MADKISKSEGKPDGVAAVDRALAILAAFHADDRALTLAELATRSGIYKSTILRLTQSLIRARLVLRLEDGRFRLGPEALRLGGLYQQAYDVSDVIVPILRELAQQTGESVIFHVREGERRVCLHRVESSQPVRYHVREGEVLPLQRGAGGRVLLAFSGARGEPYETIRRQLHYVGFGDRSPEVSGLSAPVFGPSEVLVGAMTVSGPTSRVDARFTQRAVPMLLAAAARATRNLGGPAHIFKVSPGIASPRRPNANKARS
jgi:DNA-binding IclR family transcriptional regulator